MLLTTPAMEGNEQDVHTYDIELKNVTFAYAKEDVIKDVSLKIPSGSITALVGPSGSGKSTISKLIARFWDVQKGSITIGGENIKNIEPEHLMKSISFVFQDVTLFNDTVPGPAPWLGLHAGTDLRGRMARVPGALRRGRGQHHQPAPPEDGAGQPHPHGTPQRL